MAKEYHYQFGHLAMEKSKWQFAGQNEEEETICRFR